MTYKVMHRNHLKHSNFENCWFRYVIYLGNHKKNRQKTETSPKKIPVENFWVRSVLPKKSLSRQFLCTDRKKYQGGVRSILMPPTFHIAHLDHHTRKISGVPLKVTWCQGLGVQSLCHPVCTNNIQMFLKIPETSGFEHQAVLFVMNLQTNRGIKIELEEMQRGML